MSFTDQIGLSHDFSDSDFEGYLEKKSDWKGSWRTRYFKLKKTKICWMKSEEEDVLGSLDLSDALVEVNPTKGHPHGFKILLEHIGDGRKRKNMQISANSNDERQEWMVIILVVDC